MSITIHTHQYHLHDHLILQNGFSAFRQQMIPSHIHA